MVVKPAKVATLHFLDKVFVGLLLVVFGGIVLHAPLSVGFGVLFPSFDLLIKSWKEILMVLAALIMLVILYQRKRWDILQSPLVLVITGYAALHLLLLPLYSQGLPSSIAGLFIDLRYLVFFVLVYAAIRLYPSMRRSFIVTFFVGAFVVSAFALLQVFVLPHDILKYIGYSKATIAPFLTVDQNPDFVRINSTLRGPNPLGAYAVIVLGLLFAFWLKAKKMQSQHKGLAVSVIVLGSFVALWASYSRSALFAAFAVVGIIVLATIGRRLARRFWIVLVIILIVVGGGLIVGRDSNLVSNVLLHENATTGAAVNSNEGHIESLQDGVNRMVHQPLGAGIGSTGSASLYGDHPLIVENQFLFTAHEVGWIGLGLFIYISFLVLRALWRQREDWVALGMFASGVGMILIGLLLPVWVDDTVAIIWWGLAAVAIVPLAQLDGKGKKYGRAIDKKTKRTA